MKRIRQTPRQRVAEHLSGFGYIVDEDSINVVHGGRWKTLNDVLECWNATCARPGEREVLISSAYTLTSLQKGLKLVPNRESSCLYGDLLAEPL